MAQTQDTAHPADTHDFIEVRGARENNLKDISLSIPKRRLTVFTGVSGSGKSSLVFGTIAAESQRMINETYSAFVQGFMPTLARPEVDVLSGITTAIIVDQERMGANVALHRRHRDRRERDAAHPLQPPRAAARRLAAGVLVQHPLRERVRPDRCQKGDAKPKEISFTLTGGMCPRCDGMGNVTDIDLAQLFDDSKSLADGAITIPGYTADGWYVRVFTESGFVDPTKPIRDFTERERDDFLYKEPTKVKMAGINMTYEGLVPKIRKSMLTKDVDAMQPHIRAFVERAVTFTTCPECDGTRLNEGARSSRIRGINIADACAMQISDLAEWVGGLGRADGGAPSRRAEGDARLVRRDRARATCRSTGPRARSRAARRSGPR